MGFWTETVDGGGRGAEFSGRPLRTVAFVVELGGWSGRLVMFRCVGRACERHGAIQCAIAARAKSVQRMATGQVFR